MRSTGAEIDQMLDDVSDLVERGDYREARRLLYGIESMQPTPEQLASSQDLLEATGPNYIAYAMTGTIAAFLLVVAILIF